MIDKVKMNDTAVMVVTESHMDLNIIRGVCLTGYVF